MPGHFNEDQFNAGDFNGPPPRTTAPGIPSIYNPGTGPYNFPQITIANPLAPPGLQITNYSTLINGGYKEAAVIVFRNGLRLTEGYDFIRNGGFLTMDVPPQPGDIMIGQIFSIGKQLGGSNPQRYIAPWSLPITGLFDGNSLEARISFGPTIQGLTDARNRLFTWSISFARVQLWRNGLLQTIAVDYAAGFTAAVFRPLSTPQPGDLLTILGFNAC